MASIGAVDASDPKLHQNNANKQNADISHNDYNARDFQNLHYCNLQYQSPQANKCGYYASHHSSRTYEIKSII